jgi:prolyl-tRNA synthetase
MGVPLRMEFGPKDAAKGVVTYVRRDTGVKGTVEIANIATEINKVLEQIQQDMLARAKTEYDAHRIEVTSWDHVIEKLNEKNVLLIPHCLDGACADAIKKETADMCKTLAEVDPRAPSMGAKCKYTAMCLLFSIDKKTALCIPFEQKPLPAGTKCLRPSCGKDAKQWLLCGRSY